MKLNILERISLLNLIPREGSVITLRIIKDLQKNTSFTEAELDEFKMKNTVLPDGRATIVWDQDFSNVEKDIKIGKMATSIIKRELQKLDSQNLLKMEALSLYEKFIEGKPEEDA